MAREVVIWCDPCMAEDVRTPAVEHSIGLAIGAVRPVATMTIAACPAHTDEHLKKLEALLEEFGAPIEVGDTKGASKGKRKAPTQAESVSRTLLQAEQSGIRKGRPPVGGRGFHCLWCPLTYADSGGSGIGRHLRVAHGFDGIVEAYGGYCPVCGDGFYRQMAAHYHRAHPEMGFTNASQGFLWARDNGDPHGVYAAKMEQEPSLNPEEEYERLRKKEGQWEGRVESDVDQPELEVEVEKPRKKTTKKKASKKAASGASSK